MMTHGQTGFDQGCLSSDCCCVPVQIYVPAVQQHQHLVGNTHLQIKKPSTMMVMVAQTFLQEALVLNSQVRVYVLGLHAGVQVY